MSQDLESGVTHMSAAAYVAMQNGKTRGNKYGAVRTEVDGVTFDSKAEAKRWQELRWLEDAGEIRDLVRQQRYDLVVNGVKVTTYVADFVYFDHATNRRVVEDTKGVKTAVYRLKKQLMKAIYGITISEVEA